MGIKKTKDTPECQNNATDLSAQELPSMGSKGRLAISVRCSSNSDDVKLSRELLVAQANEIIRSRQDPLSLLEVKLIRLAISQVLKRDSDFKTCSCQVVDLARYLNVAPEYLYRELPNIAESILKKTVYIQGKVQKKSKTAKIHAFNWVQSFRYEDGVVTFKLGDDLRPYLLGLNEMFTVYEYRAIAGLPTPNAIRLYELLASYRNIKFSQNYGRDSYNGYELEQSEYLFTVEWLREFFNCTNTYPNTGNFLLRVIDPSVKAINAQTLMHISYRRILKGKSVSALVFKIEDWTCDPSRTEAVFNLIDGHVPAND